MAGRINARKLDRARFAAVRYCVRTFETPAVVDACKFGTYTTVKAIAESGGGTGDAHKIANEACNRRFESRGRKFVCQTGVTAVMDAVRQVKYGHSPRLGRK